MGKYESIRVWVIGDNYALIPIGVDVVNGKHILISRAVAEDQNETN